MSYDIYLCYDCAWPIYFPNGQKMHLGTGWYCWRSQQERDGTSSAEDAPSQPHEPPTKTDPARRTRLVERATKLYGKWLDRPEKVPMVPYLQRQLILGRGDVLRGFLRYLAKQREHDVAVLLRELTQTPEWSRFARRLIPVYVPSGR